MTHIDLFIVSVLRALVEVALLALLGQGLLALLAGSRRHNNFVYRLFMVITQPVISLVRRITPKVILDKHLPFVSFFLMFWLWILLAWVKRELCVLNGLAGC
ncbi:MAG: hypothetical protein M9884_16340 [Rhodocyclaceae bacterium]|nr:hypothetical protein [Rhodocyclaceae bacterium]MCO5099014.1 hypothetical protein [Rhodocyclaceae bacterium]